MRKRLLWGLLFLGMGWCCRDTAPSSVLKGSSFASPRALLAEHGIDTARVRLYLQAFKLEQRLEVWAQAPPHNDYVLLQRYAFCTSSGTLGPKRREGDRQIPEGCYHIDRFNPRSSFYLSLGLNYPNASDRLLGHPTEPGSDIFIHGGCASVGCIPITDAGIHQLYHLADWARRTGQTDIPVNIFPARDWTRLWSMNSPHEPFWRGLHEIYLDFVRHRQLPVVRIDAQGWYHSNG